MRETGFSSGADAAGLLDASLDYLAATDWASLGTQAHGEMLAQLQRSQAKLTALNVATWRHSPRSRGMSRTGTGRQWRG